MKGPSGKGSGYAEFSSTSSTQLLGGLEACLLIYNLGGPIFTISPSWAPLSCLASSSLAPHFSTTTGTPAFPALVLLHAEMLPLRRPPN